jgi:hypothetical protein
MQFTAERRDPDALTQSWFSLFRSNQRGTMGEFAKVDRMLSQVSRSLHTREVSSKVANKSGRLEPVAGSLEKRSDLFILL